MYSLVAKVLASVGVVNHSNKTDKDFVRENKNEVIRLFNVAINSTTKEPSKPAKSMNYEEANGDAFLSSYQWRQLRMVAIKTHGARCQCCGASAATGAVIDVDHIKPRRKFPELALVLDNLQVLCDARNHGKGNWDESDWRPKA